MLLSGTWFLLLFKAAVPVWSVTIADQLICNDDQQYHIKGSFSLISDAVKYSNSVCFVGKTKEMLSHLLKLLQAIPVLLHHDFPV